MKFEKPDNKKTNKDNQEIKSTKLVQEQAPWESFNDNIGEDSKRISPNPEQVEKMNKALKDLGVLFDGFNKWHLDGALNISLFKKEYIGNHKDVDLSVERNNLKELEAFLKEKGYALFLSQNEDDKNNKKKTMRRVSHVGIENYEGHPMICAIKEDGEIDKNKDLNYVDLHIIDRDDNNSPLLDSGVHCPEEWTKSYPATKEGQQINLSHPAKVLYYKLNQGRNYDGTDIDRLLELDVIKENDIDEIKSIFEKEFIKYKEKAFALCEEISEEINKDIKTEMSSDKIFEVIKRREEFKDKDEMDQSLRIFSGEISKLKNMSPKNVFNLAISLFAVDKKNQEKIDELNKIKQGIVDKNKLSEIRNDININNDNTVQQKERNTKQYEYFLGISISDLSGKKVLNVGSGRTGLLEKEMARKNIEVFTISPSFANEGIGGSEMRDAYSKKPFLNKLRGKLKLKSYQSDINIMSSKVQEGVPLADNSMDCIFALYSVPLYLDDNKEKEFLVSEVYRVLKEKGRALLYPISDSQKKIFSDMLEKKSIKFSFTEIPEINDVVYHNELSYRLEIAK